MLQSSATIRVITTTTTTTITTITKTIIITIITELVNYKYWLFPLCYFKKGHSFVSV
jgi:hypothetical protein